MSWIDIGIFFVYMLVMLGIGFFFMGKNENVEDYYVSGRSMSKWHVGLSVVATDVGGGFSIGLGGLGFTMGIAGSWMLFTGLIGAWISAVILIPKVSKLSFAKRLLTFPQIFDHYYSSRVAFLAGIISLIGYLGFTSSQILAGAKLAAASFNGLDLKTALLLMGLVAVGYTVLGGMKAVIYTDTVQWIILMGGLILIGLPMCYNAIGGMAAIKATLSPDFISLGNIGWVTIVNWAITIIPIWFVGMTLYQRIFACKDKKEAQRAWFIAGLFEWPIMAFMGVLLGLFARVAAANGMFTDIGYATAHAMDPEMGLPILLKTILPVGLMGLMMSAYFSAVMSTADSCLIAASGNLVTDIIEKISPSGDNHKRVLKLSQIATLVLGGIALLLAYSMENVLDMMLYSYAFMVSGLLIPILGALFWKRSSTVAAFWAMLAGGCTTLYLSLAAVELPYGLNANIFGISASLIIFIVLTLLFPRKQWYEERSYTAVSSY